MYGSSQSSWTSPLSLRYKQRTAEKGRQATKEERVRAVESIAGSMPPDTV